MPIAPSIQRFVDDELARSRGLIERTLAATAQALSDAGHPAAAGVERGLRATLLDALRRQPGTPVDSFVASLRKLVLEALREQHDDTLTGTRNPPARLELMDESRVEIDIEISRATQAINAEVEWELRELQTFTSTLAGQTHVTAETNPLRPVMYATALWDAAGEITSGHAQRAALLRASTGALADLLKKAFAAACTRLESQGIEPGLYRTAVLAHGVGRREEVANLPSRPLDLLTALPAVLQPGQRASAGSAKAPDDEADLVSRLFAAMRADSQLNPAIRAVLAQLEVPALRIAASDNALLQNYEHPVWQFVNRIGDLGEAYPQAGDPRLATLLPFCRSLTDEIAQTTQHPDAALYRDRLSRLDAFLAEQLQSQLKDAQATIEALTHTEQRDLLEARLSQRLANEIAAVPTTPAMRRFATGPLARVLAESMLRFGQASDATNVYLKFVDDLLWSLAPPDHPQSRQRLAAMVPGLLQRLRDGMAMIALPQAEQQTVLDDLMAIHTESLRPGARSAPAPIGADDAAEIVRRMRDEVVPSAPGALPDGDSVIDLASMQTVPAELLPNDPPVIDSPARQIDLMQPGGHYRLFLRGRWSHTQLLWRSPQARLFLFAGENPARPHSITRRALERLNEAGLAHLKREPPLIRRTAEALKQQLAPGS